MTASQFGAARKLGVPLPCDDYPYVPSPEIFPKKPASSRARKMDTEDRKAWGAAHDVSHPPYPKFFSIRSTILVRDYVAKGNSNRVGRSAVTYHGVNNKHQIN